MGLGKTLQTIALLLERAKDGVSLVVAPASVCGNWRNEIRRFAPTLEPIVAMDEDEESIEKAGPRAVVIASYGYLLFHEALFRGMPWNGIVLDEAQAIMKPLILRRLKGEVLDDLPQKTEVTRFVELSVAERSAYEACRLKAQDDFAKADKKKREVDFLVVRDRAPWFLVEAKKNDETDTFLAIGLISHRRGSCTT